MKKNILIIILICLAALATWAFSAEDKYLTDGYLAREVCEHTHKGNIDFNFCIKNVKLHYGENLFFGLEIKNTGNQLLRVYDDMLYKDLLWPIMHIGYEKYGIYIKVKDSKGHPIKGSRPFVKGCNKPVLDRGTDTATLKPGWSFKTATWAFNGLCGNGRRKAPNGYAELWNFNLQPGKYKIQAVYNTLDPCSQNPKDKYSQQFCKKHPALPRRYGQVLVKTDWADVEVLP